ncbi:MAG: ATP-binding protein [Burkholderiales bacterium]
MNRVGGISANLRRPGPRQALRCATAAGVTWPVAAAAQAATASSLSLPLLLAVALAIAAIGVGILLAARGARTERELTAQLREARARSASLEPLLEVWLWQSDAQHRLVSIRPPHGAAAGEWSGALQSAPLAERFAPADASALQAMLASAAALDDIEVQLASPDTAGAAARPGLLRGRSHVDASGRFAGYFGTFHERRPVVMTAPPELPVAASPAKAAPVAATTPGDHESFSFTVSHDLRAPIRVVEGFTKIVKEDYGRLLDRVGNDHLDRVLGAAARMNNMIDALLALSKLSSQPLARQPVNLSQLAGYVADDLRRQWPERAVQLEIDPDMQVQGDPTLLRVVIENLLGNAWKYSAKVPQASIRFGRHAQDADAFSVQDNGAGFDMRFADRLFGVFQRLHSANDFPGTGVGLASVRRIVRRHGGEIWGEAEVNRGARFHFSLPQG